MLLCESGLRYFTKYMYNSTGFPLPIKEKLVHQKGPRLETPNERSAGSAGALVVLVCGPHESTSRWTRKNSNGA